MTREEDLATWRTSVHGILYWLERSLVELADCHEENGSARRRVMYDWEMLVSRRITKLEAEAKRFNDDTIREAIAHSRARMGYLRCEIKLGKGFA